MATPESSLTHEGCFVSRKTLFEFAYGFPPFVQDSQLHSYRPYQPRREMKRRYGARPNPPWRFRGSVFPGIRTSSRQRLPCPIRARFEPDAPLSYSTDIWGLAITIWEMLGMKAIFSNEFTTLDDVTSQQVDVLGPMPSRWWESWDERT